MNISMRLSFVFLTAVLLMSACDFPSDPPLKSPEQNDPVITPTGPKHLLPLRDGNVWIYVIASRARPNSAPLAAYMRKLQFEERAYYLLRYGSFLGPAGNTRRAFPLLLAEDSTGLGFYQPGDPQDSLRLSTEPTLSFHLPYPAKPGNAWIQHRGAAYSTRLRAVDVLLPVLNSGIALLCHRYEVALNNRIIETLYIVPGVCILRVETEEEEYHTVSWQLR